ncbi:12883_t:CDS:2 [Acaulospora colombiana]|uniref:12883_t:CDS:1 n=1 Tax=Acaulospora colombiana TaxID=27376 RepID=A0ACA9MMT2_9GLOM|nr:12883_t:CDS:2 [Acaulospora colombiana]
MPSLFKTIVAALAVTASPALANLSLLRSPVPYAQVANRAQSPGRMMGPAPASPRSKTWSSLSIMILSLMQSIATVNVAAASHLTFTVNPSIGPNGSAYFIRFRTPNAAHTSYSANPTSVNGGALKNDDPGSLAAGVAVVVAVSHQTTLHFTPHQRFPNRLDPSTQVESCFAARTITARALDLIAPFSIIALPTRNTGITRFTGLSSKSLVTESAITPGNEHPNCASTSAAEDYRMEDNSAMCTRVDSMLNGCTKNMALGCVTRFVSLVALTQLHNPQQAKSMPATNAPLHELIPVNDDTPDLVKQCIDLRITVFVDEQKFPLDTEIDQCEPSVNQVFLWCPNMLYISVDDGTGKSTHLLLRLVPSLEPIGTVRLVHLSSTEKKLGRLCVLEEYRNFKFGKDLVLAAHDYLLNQGSSPGAEGPPDPSHLLKPRKLRAQRLTDM